MKIINKLREYFSGSISEPAETQAMLNQWFEQFPGQAVLEEEKVQLVNILPTLFGYHLLQIGYCQVIHEALESSRISHRMVLNADSSKRLDCNASTVGALPEVLPFQADSLDVILVSHALEYSSSPHQILREIDRCLIPEGHAVFVCFNPLGFSSLWRLLFAWKGRPPWNGRFISRTRLRDWLELLGFDVNEIRCLFYRPPFRHLRLMRRLGFLERLGKRWWPIISGVYIMVAQKRVATLTPLKPRWRPRRSRLVAPGLAGSSNASSSSSRRKSTKVS